MRRFAIRLTTLLGIFLTAALLVVPADAKGGKGRDQATDHNVGRSHSDDRHQQEKSRYSPEEMESWWQGLPEQDREHLRQRYERHLQNLPPEQRDRLRDRWQRFRDLPPEQQDKLRRHYQRWQELPPAERERLQSTWRNFRELPPDRQKTLKEELRKLRGVPDAEREQRRLELHRRYFPDLPPPPPRRGDRNP